jgi:hypothetical protein
MDSILLEIAGALAARTTGALFDLVKSTFSRHRKAELALESAIGEKPDSTPVLALAERLAQVEEAEPEFKKQLRDEWAKIAPATVTNTITGDVSGNVVQARDIIGGVNFR